MDREKLRSLTGKSLADLDITAVMNGEVHTEDFRISGDTLRMQAETAENAGYVELAGNLRRAAELTRISNEEVLEIYTALRPGRTSYERLIKIAGKLETQYQASETAKLVREAAEVYLQRGLINRSNC